MDHSIRAILIRSVITLPLLTYCATTQAMTLNINENQLMCLDVAPGFNCADIPQYVITGRDGIRIGETQAAIGSHNGSPDGTENPGIDEPWEFFGNTGMHLTTSPVTILSQNANTMTLDFSGWAMTWNGNSVMPLGTGAHHGGTDGVAEVTCAVDCGDGDTYFLEYWATFPTDDPSGFGGVQYDIHIAGTVSTVPIPAAIWLFGSGFIALLYRARKYGHNNSDIKHAHG